MPLGVSGIFLLILVAFDFIKQNYYYLCSPPGQPQRKGAAGGSSCLSSRACLALSPCMGVCVCVCLLGGLFDDVKMGQYRWRCAYRYYPAIRGRLVAAWLLM